MLHDPIEARRIILSRIECLDNKFKNLGILTKAIWSLALVLILSFLGAIFWAGSVNSTVNRLDNDYRRLDGRVDHLYNSRAVANP